MHAGEGRKEHVCVCEKQAEGEIGQQEWIGADGPKGSVRGGRFGSDRTKPVQQHIYRPKVGFFFILILLFSLFTSVFPKLSLFLFFLLFFFFYDSS